MTKKEANDLFCWILLIFILIFIFVGFGILIGKRIERKTNPPQTINKNECEPYFPEFPPSKGVVLFPEKGILIMKFSDEVEFLIKQNGCK